MPRLLSFPSRQNQFIQENYFNNAPIRCIAIAMNTNSAFTASFTENPYWYQQFGLRHIRILRSGQSVVGNTYNNCHLYVTTIRALNVVHDDIPSVLIDKLKDHYVLVFDLTSMQDEPCSTRKCNRSHYIG